MERATRQRSTLHTHTVFLQRENVTDMYTRERRAKVQDVGMTPPLPADVQRHYVSKAVIFRRRDLARVHLEPSLPFAAPFAG